MLLRTWQKEGGRRQEAGGRRQVAGGGVSAPARRRLVVGAPSARRALLRGKAKAAFGEGVERLRRAADGTFSP
jgi:hypothetical protein